MNRFIFNYSTGFQYRNSLTSLNLLHEKFWQPFKNVLSLSNESYYIQLFNWISIMCRNSFVLLNLLAQKTCSIKPEVNLLWIGIITSKWIFLYSTLRLNQFQDSFGWLNLLWTNHSEISYTTFWTQKSLTKIDFVLCIQFIHQDKTYI